MLWTRYLGQDKEAIIIPSIGDRVQEALMKGRGSRGMQRQSRQVRDVFGRVKGQELDSQDQLASLRVPEPRDPP